MRFRLISVFAVAVALCGMDRVYGAGFQCPSSGECTCPNGGTGCVCDENNYIDTSKCCRKDCSNKCADGIWKPSSVSGHEAYHNAQLQKSSSCTCADGLTSCTATCGCINVGVSDYRCAVGYYGTSVDGTSGCTQCPLVVGVYSDSFLTYEARGTTVDAGNGKSQSDCYLANGGKYYDATGDLTLTGNCTY
ncbi:MAG: hypothetical protein LBJ73_05040 [Rickettsiales bacterium]|jgi:hypothetical protein|nr:hypothetical protein [Rickettsiales bacterium]